MATTTVSYLISVLQLFWVVKLTDTLTTLANSLSSRNVRIWYLPLWTFSGIASLTILAMHSLSHYRYSFFRNSLFAVSEHQNISIAWLNCWACYATVNSPRKLWDSSTLTGWQDGGRDIPLLIARDIQGAMLTNLSEGLWLALTSLERTVE